MYMIAGMVVLLGVIFVGVCIWKPHSQPVAYPCCMALNHGQSTVCSVCGMDWGES